MRLRLVINRNSLPTMKIWWDTSALKSGDDRNISSLLICVSQIVPLEFSKWGLEDYAVEIGGFECLHFQEVDSIIRDGDEVVIRPLSSHEIKQRRLSGRRQISASGRKLIDGTPFGRTFLRPAPDRPALTARPAKRRRIEGFEFRK
ncbi:hypothetical protein DFP73DRAFT_73094 [Morchella snyderi]|nr:hypothetical protein DFP73DRAFT_73094 [Morchella snyderi]